MIFLTGFMGTGKTTVGRLLAQRLGILFIDLDEMIVESAGISIPEIFSAQGEERFRDLESAELSRVAGQSTAVVATGGGAVLRKANRLMMKESGFVVNLHASKEVILERISGDTGRPLLDGGETDMKVSRLFTEREPLYRECHVQIDTSGKSPQAIVNDILAWLKTEQPESGGAMELHGNAASRDLTVGLGERSYSIRIGIGTLPGLGELCRDAGIGRQLALITNPTVGDLYGERAVASLESAGFSVTTIRIGDGERYKSLDTLAAIFEGLISGGMDRGSTIIALGGGVVGDIAGFAAATFLRGIPFVQVPTTLLAQVDSSVGGKTGINVPKGKNLVGAFYQPRLVVIDVSTLHTLPEREFLSGLAEVVKYGIVLDKELFEFIEKNSELILARDNQTLAYIVQQCCRIKASVVEQDERESGLRAVLNYGHTLGHAVETLSGYTRYTHGEAVGIGMAAAARYSERLGLAGHEDTARILALLKNLGIPVDPPAFLLAEYRDAMFRDKKVRDGGITFVCNKGIGEFTFERVEDVQPLLEACGIGG